MSAINTPSPSPEPAEQPSPRKFKPGPVLNLEDDEVATLTGSRQTQAHKDAASMLLGYGTVRLGTIILKHGVVSAREKSAAALQRLEQSFEDNGVLRYSNPIILLVELSELECEFPLASKLDGDIPSVTFYAPADGSKPVVLCAAGQHREEVVLRRIDKLESEIADLEEGADHDESSISVLRSCIDGERVWAAAFYKKSAVLKRGDPAATAVGNLLSSNQRLWQWEATPQELWQLGIRWIRDFGTERKILLKAIGETRKFPWLGGLLVKKEWRDALTTLLKYPGLKKDVILKECGQWCSQPYSQFQIALFLLEGVVVRIVALSSTTETHYPQLWSPELAAFLVKEWATVNEQIRKSPSSDHAGFVDQYHENISKRLCKEWEKNVVMENGDDHPTVEDIAKAINAINGGSNPVLLSWEGILPKIGEWKACGEGLNEVARWLDPGMGEFHSKAHGSVKLGTATEYIWSDFPKSPNRSVEEDRTAFSQLLSDIQSDLKNMSIAVLDLRSQVQVELSASDVQNIEKLTDYYVNEHRTLKRSQGTKKAEPVNTRFRHMFDILMTHSAIKFHHFDSKNRPKQYRRYITALVTESEVQKVYIPMLLQYASARQVRKHVQDFYQDRDGTISIFWNDFGIEALRKGIAIEDDETYKQQLQLVARESILKQLSAPYRRLVQSGGLPRGVAREAMLSFLGVVSRYLGDEDAGDDDDVAALKILLGPNESDEEYEPSSESDPDSEPAPRKSKKGGLSARNSAKAANSSRNKGKRRSVHAENRSAPDDGQGASAPKPSKTQYAVLEEQGKHRTARGASEQSTLAADKAPLTKESVTRSTSPELQGKAGSEPSTNRETVSSEIASRSQESVSGVTAIVTNVERAPAPSRSANASLSNSRQGATPSQSANASLPNSRQGSQPRGAGATSGTSQPESRTAANVNAGAQRGANLERTGSRQSLARSPSWDEGIDDVNDPASQVGANKGSANLRSNEPGSSRVHSSSSLPSEEPLQTRIRNPFINATRMKELEQATRPVKTKVSNPFAVKRKGNDALDLFQPSSSTAGPSLTRKRSMDEDGESDIEEIDALPAGKKTRVAPKEKPTMTSLQPAMNNNNTEAQPSDIGELHPGLQETESPRQSGRQQLNLPAATEDALRSHILLRATPLPISAVYRLPQASTLKSAFGELRRKTIIPWREATMTIDDPLLIWDAPAHYLDYICIVGSDIGFDPIILPPGARQSALTCKLGMASRPMRDKYIPMTWDCRGTTYFIGFFEGKQVWLLFQPDDPDGVEHDPSTTTTSLSLLRQRRFSLLWAGVLQNLPKTNVVVRDQYADCTSDEAYALATNFRERGTDDPQLSQHTLGMLQTAFTQQYTTWAEQAPWKDDDPFFVQSTPTLVVNQYGQNQRIFNHGPGRDGQAAYRAEVDGFSKEFNWPAVGMFTYAIATTMRYATTTPVHEWSYQQSITFSARQADRLEPTPEAFTTRPLYSTPDLDTREQVLIEEIEEALEARRVPEVFDEDGNRVQCHQPVLSLEDKDCGILLNLDSVPAQVRAADDDRRPPEYTTFPLAYCKGIGNCQASTHLQFYHPFVDRVNYALQHADQEAFLPPVQRGPHQIYNEIAHKTRSRDGLHDAQRGYVTAAMSGECLKGANLTNAHSRAQKMCETQLPSESYTEKLLRTGHYIGLRSEPTITINVQALPEGAQTGRSMWPQMLYCATWPVSAAIESLWEAHQSRPKGIGAEWDEIELVCLLERLLVFGQTGNGQVINGALSEAFGLKHSLETTGFPTFSSALDTNRPTPKIRQGFWPTRGPDNQAVTCANATIRYYYNESVSQTHTAKATLGLLLERAPTSSNNDLATEISELLANHLVDVLLRDIKAYVVDQCAIEIERLQATGSLEERNHAAQRQRYLDEWRRHRTPWGQGEPYRALILAVVYGPRDDPKFEPSHPGVLTTGELAEKVVECMEPSANMKSSPLWVNNGAFKELAPTVWEVASIQVGLGGKELRRLMNHVVARALMKSQVCRLPWVTVSSQRGISRHIGLRNWVTIQRSEEPDRHDHRLETPLMRQERIAAQLAAEAKEQDQTAAWEAFSGNLSDQRRYIRRTIRPDDLDFDSVIGTTSDPTMKAYLTRIADDFNLEKPSHRLGLRVASLASRLLPLVNLKAADDAQPGMSVDKTIQNGMVWCQSTRKDPNAGLTNRDQWASAFTLAWLFYQSTPPTHPIIRSPAYAVFLKKLAGTWRRYQTH
ncbi:hypothetical protein FRC00_003661 [Tulasnella sp. 408]|nr:hypothetical protein FRC00_003661 [Tulasnella sp. 408]